MNPRVLRRFIMLMGGLIVVAMIATLFADVTTSREPGDLATELGAQRLEDGRYEEALTYFSEALRESPDHRGAIMGRAHVFMKQEKYPDAVAELNYLIEYLTRTLEPNDTTGRGALAVAYHNRAIIRDRLGKYEQALADYISAIKTDEDTVDEPGVIHNILYGNANPSSARKRAVYLYEQLKLPPGKRLMRVPEIDAQQRMRKP
ncbi:MAG: tetratricopeptide repeat protein [Rhodospirillaceae bacterium]|jgi:tetratricopeptide (TPR) repeat protein|nr:tetratricopeptide repeat protein [Rhodospirillaceae bacterium]MBT5664723.1 tetratricopeptide repeat protein [Rhodospirillaceae bacterium]MBT5810567.1 tetratricopeptide repeat protein [Rhodospirillaceae bacterium]